MRGHTERNGREPSSLHQRVPCHRNTSLLVCAATLVWVAAPGCHRRVQQAPPPDARRPVIRTEAELAAERQARIEAGELVPTTTPAIAGDRPASRARRALPAVPEPQPNSIQADILLVNDTALTVAEVLYPLRERLEALWSERTESGFRDEARRLIRRQTQQEIGAILIYAEARSELDEPRRKVLDEAVDKELESLTNRHYEGSRARLENHLKTHQLTREQLRNSLARNIVVRQYTREKLMPQVQVRRDELYSFYRGNLAKYSTQAARELRMIELPFERFLPEGRAWDRASSADKAAARLKAKRRAGEAHEALTQKSFAEVAQEFSLGPRAADGGSWGMIGRPLQAPYDKVSALIFEHEAGWTSEPIEIETGWVIVQCGQVNDAAQQEFTAVQEQIRNEVRERRFNRLSTEFVLKLAERATISSLEPFVSAAVARAEQLFPAAES